MAAPARHLPQEIIENILLKLPIKSLFRFKSVSKSWNFKISDPRFIRTHYQLSMVKSENNLFIKDDEDGWFSIVRWEGRQLKYEAGDSFLGRLYKTFLCIGDGLILLDSAHSSYDHKTYLLWNPRTRKEIILRFPYYTSDLQNAMYGVCYDPINRDLQNAMYGVCYDPINEDVKVVIASKGFYIVYSCKNRFWTEKKKYSYGTAAGSVEGGLAVDGAIYWASYCWTRMIIVYFDSKDDSFKILQKPEDQKDDQRFKLKARRSELYLCCNEEDGRRVKIWVKEKGEGWSWKVLVNIDNLYNVSYHPIVVAPLTEKEMILWLVWDGYCIYNCCDKSYREIEVHITMWDMLHPFLETMFPIHY